MAKRNRLALSLESTSSSVLKLDDVAQLDPVLFDSIDPELYADWYLGSCYPQIPFHDEKLILDFLVENAPSVNGSETMLDIGCGPVVSHILPFEPYVKSFILSDYLDTNLEKIHKWVRKDEDAHDWSLHTSYILKKQKRKNSRQDVFSTENSIRKKIKTLVVGDLLSKKPLRKSLSFPTVSCFYATEQAASDQAEWLDVVTNLSSLIEPGGTLFMSCIRETDYYAIHSKEKDTLKIPITNVSQKLIEKALKTSGFSFKNSEILSKDVNGLSEEGINGIYLIKAVKAE